MNRIATTPRGFPFDEKTLSELQEQTVPVLKAIARLLPDRSIIYGCDWNWETLSRNPGFIIWDGELMPFIGGPPSGEFSIMEDVQNRTFNVGTDQDPQLEDHPAYYKRFAQSGNIEGAESVHALNLLKAPPRFLTYFRKGTKYCGQVSPITTSEGGVISVTFDTLVETPAYMVFCNFYRSNEAAQGSFDFDVFEKTTSGFKVRIKNITADIEGLFLEYLIVPRTAGIIQTG